MRLRPAVHGDAGPIAILEGELTPGQIEATLAQPATLAFVAEIDGTLVGHVLATAAADQGEICWITVDPARRRSGVARALLAALEAAWHERGVAEAWLEVRTDNDPARALYASLGWTGQSVRKGYYRDGADALVLRKAVLSRTP